MENAKVGCNGGDLLGFAREPYEVRIEVVCVCGDLLGRVALRIHTHHEHLHLRRLVAEKDHRFAESR